MSQEVLSPLSGLWRRKDNQRNPTLREILESGGVFLWIGKGSELPGLDRLEIGIVDHNMDKML